MTHTTENAEAGLLVGAANTIFEQQADAVAHQVMRMPEQPLVQRKCAHCEEEKAQRMPLTSFIQRKAEAGGSQASQTVTNQIQTTKGWGTPLPATTRSFMETRFGTDFSGVNIHTGDYAVQLSRELNAQAFTVGNDIYFNSGKYAPDSTDGRQLLAHELTHTVQQSSGVQMKSIQRLVIDSHIQTTPGILTALGLTRQQVIDTIRDANTDAITLAQTAEDMLTTQLANAVAGSAVDPNAELILNEELNLSFNNPAQRGLIREQISRFRTVRETLESGYLRYLALGINNVSLTGCSPGNCTDAFAFSCPGNRLTVLCQPFWNDPAEQGSTILHEPFHIWFHMARHAANALRRADASCFESFALRAAGRNAPASCAAHTAG